ncbi:6-phosphogluconolactonase [Maribacter halichondriae]|uniref:6-phosphogluconolactonase n=1 Tax=Maribacter halichondriae TaxID=2980554 RepID=UPI002359A4AB|nr:6-phosphogluconolactonase [Maribacter sp. Hal144]
MQLNISKTKQDVANNFADYLGDLMSSSESLHIALSGGSTPKIVFDELASREIPKDVWKKVHLYWGDERCVPPTDDESNYKMTVEHLISKVEIPEKNIHRIKGENKPEYEAERYTDVLKKELPKTNKLPKFDLVILGMGDDGHTASIFPHEIDLWHSDKLCEVAEHPESGQKRITMTGRIINHATEVTFLVTGGSKAEKVSEIINQEGDFKNYPANLVAPASGKLLWFLDKAAAAGITSTQS